MAYCKNKNISIYYEQHGNGVPIVLVHGGAVSFSANYAMYGWVESLTQCGFRVIGLDLRGHGLSEKPLDVSAYGTANLAGDVLAVMDELDLKEVSIVGYSLGSAVALHLIQAYPTRFSKAALVATGDGLLGYPPHVFADLLPVLASAVSREKYPDDLPPYVAAYWTFVAESGGSRQAIAAAAQASYPPLSIALASSIQQPVLVVSGEHDPVLGRGPRLAEAFPNGTYMEIPKADHFSLAASSRVKKAIAEFMS